GIACAYKHFPGHGSALGDTHEGFVDVTETFIPDELVPYKGLQKEQDKPLMVMTAHVINRHLDTLGLPATLSHDIITTLLRGTMGYEGLVISDDLQMRAIADQYSLEESLCLTLNAGADMVIFANQLGDNSAFEVIDAIEQLVLDKKVDIQRIDEAFKRIIRLKGQIS
ncbi:MAG: glycoside hydrolase family 3 N-terminal domain-containing protein, partial [Legionellales bacterium]